MRSGGFPCRFHGCERAFQVTDPSSMDSLRAASAARTEHEINTHAYSHVQLDEARRQMPYVRVKPKPEEAGKPTRP